MFCCDSVVHNVAISSPVVRNLNAVGNLSACVYTVCDSYSPNTTVVNDPV